MGSLREWTIFPRRAAILTTDLSLSPRYPIPFKCEFKPRSASTAELIQAAMVEFD